MMVSIHNIGGVPPDCNIFLIIDETIALVDAGTGLNLSSVERNLRRFDLSPADVELVINTHCHYDHAGGDLDFALAGCEVAIHELEAELLRIGDQHVTCAYYFGRELRRVEVATELREGDRIELGELELEVLHTPGHTAGSVCLYEPGRKLLFSGDTVFCGGVGRVDVPTGDASAMVRSIKRLAELDVRELFPGHGPADHRNASRHIEAALRIASAGWL